MRGDAEPLSGPTRCQGAYESGPNGRNEMSYIRLQGISLYIGTQVHRPGIGRDVRLGEGNVCRTLAEVEVVGEGHRVPFRVRVVMQIIVGIFEFQRSRVTRGPVQFVAALNEEILVRLPLGAERESGRATDDGAGESAFGAV